MFYKGNKDADLCRDAQIWGARYAAAGTVRNLGDRLHVTSKVMEATTGNMVGRQRHDPSAAQALTIAVEIAQEMVASMTKQNLRRSRMSRKTR